MPLIPNRREMLAGALLAPAAANAAAQPQGAVGDVAADLARYAGFGIKHAGGEGDNRCGIWLEAELNGLGFATDRQTFDVPWFEPDIAALTIGSVSVPVVALALTVTTAGIAGRLVPVASDTLTGAIAVIELPYGRWGTALSPQVRRALERAQAGGAVAALLVTTGPTGEAICLNVPAHGPLVTIPVAILAPKHLPLLGKWLGGQVAARLRITGQGGRRSAFNLRARLDRGAARWLAISTPRSGWTMCAGERGPGIAAWLALARWARHALPDTNLFFACNSGHEYENLGAGHLLEDGAPPPDRTALWLHLGANVATRDWHEAGAGNLFPLPSADTQRYLMATPPLLTTAAQAFAGLPGLEQPYPSRPNAPGELGNILAAGYPNSVGIYGGHRFHHVAGDTLAAVYPPLVEAVIAGCQRLICAAPLLAFAL